MDWERLRLSQRNVLRTNMWSILLSTYDIVNKDKDRIKRDTLISVEIKTGYFARCQWRHYDTKENVTDEETSQTDTAEMKNLNEKRKTESGILTIVKTSTDRQ
jgi:hypothetical protein